MNINYEVLFMVMFGLVVVGLYLIMRLLSKINDLSNEIAAHVLNIKEDIRNTQKQIDHIDRNLLALWDWLEEGEEDADNDDEDCKWTPEPEEEPEPGEVVTRGELTVEINEDPIHLITPNQFFFEDVNHSQFKLEYHSNCDELRFYYNDFSDEHIVVDNVEQCIGEGLKFFGLHSKDNNVVYVRNNVFRADFMIAKVG